MNDSTINTDSTKARRDHARHLLRTDPFDTKSLLESLPGKRQAAGAFLDPAVYRYYGCGGQAGSIEDIVIENEADYCAPAGNCPAIVPIEISGTDDDVPVGPGTPNDPSETTPTPTITQPPASSTSYISCRTQNQQPGQGITEAHCICDGSTFPQSTATDPPNSCAYTTLPGPSATISITRLPTGPTSTDEPSPTSCFVPDGCRNVAENGCAVLCDEPTPTPEPEPNDKKFFIMARELVVASRGGALINWSWVGLSVPLDEEISVGFCNFNDYPRAISDGVGRSSPPRFPVSLGPFDLEGHDDCTYEGPADGPPGVITCSGGYEATCLEISENQPPLDCAPGSGNPARDNYFFALGCFYR